MKKACLISLLFLLVGCGKEETVYQGKPISYWVKQLNGINEEARVEAAKALGQVGVEGMAALVEAFRSGPSAVRSAAADALGVIGPQAKEAKAALTAALQDDDHTVRQHAAYALGLIDPHDSTIVPVLVECLKDKDLEVRRHAALALGRLGPTAKEAVSAIQDAFKDADSQLKVLLREAIQKINLEIPAHQTIDPSGPPG
jgi:HEAT repeat protein